MFYTYILCIGQHSVYTYSIKYIGAYLLRPFLLLTPKPLIIIVKSKKQGKESDVGHILCGLIIPEKFRAEVNYYV